MNRIIIVTNSITGGGAERSMNLLANSLFEQGIPVTLITINESDPDAVLVKCPIISINRKWNGSLLNTINSWIKFQKILIELNASVLILNCDLPEFYGGTAFTRAKIICVEHSDHPWQKRQKLGRVIRKILKLRGVIWVAVSYHLNIWPSQKEPKLVINNLVWESGRPLPLDGGAIKRLIYIGRLSNEKNPELFLEIANETKIPAVIIGDGELKYELQKFVISKNIKVEFKGFLQDPWVLLNNGDLLIITSKWEGDGLVAVEAIQRGVPLIVSNIYAFKRFQLPMENYARNKLEYVTLILQNQMNSQIFRVSLEKKIQILEGRDKKIITSKWSNLIDLVVKKS